jgi:phosphoserine phosphatase
MSAAIIRVSGIEDPRSILQLQVKKERKGAVLDLDIRNNPRTLELLAMNNPQLKLVSFDLDGTILRGRILDYVKMPDALHGTTMEHDEQEKLGYEDTLVIQLSLFTGMKIDEIAPDPTKLPLIEDLDATLQGLNRAGVRTVILTDNPSFAAEPLRRHGFRDIIASEIETLNGVLTARMKLLTNKLDGLREYCRQHNIELASCAHVSDWTNDVVVFKSVGVSVEFNAFEQSVSKAATYVVNSDSLLDVYRVLEPSLPTR